ncbi:myosin light chain kinase, smooth muscle-like [Fundulus heteroclitus]|uniref:myosin light chain kinase, smooth muscle-like n=1 Tax=Fundulus heteroclitus TaxID=8078 RepID=UPI00165ACBBB|nr:myosin light chain kinase, smooth muscle-like [Fundulus heteroclitus]
MIPPIKSPKRVMSPTLEKKPFFSAVLRDITASCDSIVKLSVKVTGEPKPAVSWSKDGKAISQGGKYELFEDQCSAHLEIYESEVSDSGVYKCTATNSSGAVSTSCTVTVQAPKSSAMISEEVLRKEMIHEEIRSSVTEVKSSEIQKSVREGQSLTLRANIHGASNIKWILNGQQLANSEQYRYGVSGSDQTLTIRCVTQREQGIITCQAQTEQGLVRCQFNTDVTPKSSEAPHFLVQPRSQNVDQGQNVMFTCEIAGDPSPEVEWLKDNTIICVTPNIKLSRSKNSYTLEICEATVADSGKYTIKARNQFGQCSATSSLNVLSTPPKIEALPQHVSAEPGKSLSVAGMFSGDPAPSVQWVRSGRTLPNGDERFHVDNAADLSTLMISAVKEDDAGAYTLRLSNELGSDSATVNVHIRSM